MSSLISRISSLITSIGGDVKDIQDTIADLQPADVGFIVVAYPSTVPSGTPDGTIMVEYIP